MIELGADPKVIQQRLGHASIRTTMDVYGKMLPEVDEGVTDGLGELLAGAGEFSRGLTAASGDGGSGGPRSGIPDGSGKGAGGGDRIRTDGLYVANVAL